MTEPSDSSDGKAVSHSEVSRIAVKVPPFWRENPAIWFSQLESQFITSGIVQDSTKYHTVVASVETEILSQVSDIITSPPNDDMYKTLKERLINFFSDSEERRLKKLLQDVELDDKRRLCSYVRCRIWRETALAMSCFDLYGCNACPHRCKQF
ncbi:hypothetical protein AVEN_103637-1 [Araneus ventricosus]|uniref:DUF7041 domain-containing protein n=1 Tax=Araneus ventricosus TaxID=182803 RepID=A0A4Y2HBI4_ARAVE|nr:hypothetical protein AVEN_103637-1 [Araneus ventricosus]